MLNGSNAAQMHVQIHVHIRPNAFTKKFFTKSESEETHFQMPHGLTSAVIAKTQHSKQESPSSTPPNTELHSTITAAAAAAAASAATTTTTTTTTTTCYKLAEPCNAQKRFCSFFFRHLTQNALHQKSFKKVNHQKTIEETPLPQTNIFQLSS